MLDNLLYVFIVVCNILLVLGVIFVSVITFQDNWKGFKDTFQRSPFPTNMQVGFTLGTLAFCLFFLFFLPPNWTVKEGIILSCVLGFSSYVLYCLVTNE